MIRIGLTGNVASGKSSVARVWERLGAHLIDADVLARRAVEPGSPGLERVRAAFGDDVITPDGSLDRAAVRRIVFADPGARTRLEAIIHPEVAWMREAEEARAAEEGANVVVHDIPLLFEVGLEDAFDVLVLVDAPEDLRAERLRRHRGLTDGEIRGLFASQMPAAAKRPRADIVIDNTGTVDELERKAEDVWRTLDLPTSASSASLRVDMHIHTHCSFDCRSDRDRVVERARAVGLHRVCITDHDDIEAALDLAERYPDTVIPGEEVKTAERVDVIGLFLTEWIPGGTPARETCERIRAQGGLVYVPHPFAGGKGGGGRVLPEIEDLVDVVEGFNARIHDQALNRRAQEWAADRGLPVGAGSDAHTLREIGRAFAEVASFEHTAEAFLAALARGRIRGQESSRLVHIASTIAKVLP